MHGEAGIIRALNCLEAHQHCICALCYSCHACNVADKLAFFLQSEATLFEELLCRGLHIDVDGFESLVDEVLSDSFQELCTYAVTTEVSSDCEQVNLGRLTAQTLVLAAANNNALLKSDVAGHCTGFVFHLRESGSQQSAHLLAVVQFHGTC